MYIRGEYELSFGGGTETVSKPKSIFAGLANTLTIGTWQTHEVNERIGYLALIDSVHETLSKWGAVEWKRFQVGAYSHYVAGADPGTFHRTAEQAIADAQRSDPAFDMHVPMTMVLRIHCEPLIIGMVWHFQPVHPNNKPAARVRLSGVPAILHRGQTEEDAAYAARLAQTRVASARAYEGLMKSFMRNLFLELEPKTGATICREKTGPVKYTTATRETLPDQTAANGPIEGLDPFHDLSYLLMVSDLQSARAMQGSGVYIYSDAGSAGWAPDSPVGDPADSFDFGGDFGMAGGDFFGDAASSGFDGGGDFGMAGDGGDGGGGDGGGGDGGGGGD